MERVARPEHYDDTATEAVAVFHDIAPLQAAIDDLLTQGFDHAELSILASDKAIRAKLGDTYSSTTEFEDDPDVPRMGYVPGESIGDAKGAIIGAAMYFPAVVGSLLVVGSGGTLIGAVSVAALAGGAGAAVGAALARLIGSDHANILDEQLARGGIVLWVRTRDKAHEDLAIKTLKRHGGDHVHLHVLSAPRIRTSNIPTRQPALSFGRPH